MADDTLRSIPRQSEDELRPDDLGRPDPDDPRIYQPPAADSGIIQLWPPVNGPDQYFPPDYQGMRRPGVGLDLGIVGHPFQGPRTGDPVLRQVPPRTWDQPSFGLGSALAPFGYLPNLRSQMKHYLTHNQFLRVADPTLPSAGDPISYTLEGGPGSSEDPYPTYTEEQLEEMARQRPDPAGMSGLVDNPPPIAPGVSVSTLQGQSADPGSPTREDLWAHELAGMDPVERALLTQPSYGEDELLRYHPGYARAQQANPAADPTINLLTPRLDYLTGDESIRQDLPTQAERLPGYLPYEDIQYQPPLVGPLAGSPQGDPTGAPTGGPGAGPATSSSPAQADPFQAALQQYPILSRQGLAGIAEQPAQGVLEFWSPDETGTVSSPRPAGIPLGTSGVQYGPQTRPIDVLGDWASHLGRKTDPIVKQYYDDFAASLSPEQRNFLRNRYEHDVREEGETRPYQVWEEESGLPGYFRGYPFQQWDKEFNEQVYTPEQRGQLDRMMDYLRTGKQSAAPAGPPGGSVNLPPSNPVSANPLGGPSGLASAILGAVGGGEQEAQSAVAGQALNPALFDYLSRVASGQTLLKGLQEINEDPSQLGLAFAGGALGTKLPTLYHGAARPFAPEPGAPLGRPSSEKLLSGEGYHSEGRGFYASETPKVAEWYQKAYGEFPPEIVDAAKRALAEQYPPGYHYRFASGGGWEHVFDGTLAGDEAFMKKIGFDPDKPSDWVRAAARETGFDNRVRFEPGMPGALYELRAPQAEIEHFLEWEKPLREQSDYVKQRLKRLGIDENRRTPLVVEEHPYAGLSGFETPPAKARLQGDLKGEEIYELIGHKYGPSGGEPLSWLSFESERKDMAARAAALLRLQGIRGTRYPAADLPGNKGKSNYSFFTPESLEIIRKLGLAGLIGGAGGAAAAGQAEAADPAARFWAP